MEEIKTKGIVIKAVDYKDSDKIVTIFSAEFGLIKARVRGVKKAKAKLSFAVQPFAFIEFILSKNGDFYTVINASSIDQFFNVTTDFDSYIFMLSCLEVIEKTVKENQIEPKLFLLTLNSLKAVCYDNVSSVNVFFKFMLESFEFLGYTLRVDCCSICGNSLKDGFFAFNFDCNGFICAKCANKNDYLEMSKNEYLILKYISETNLSKLGNLKFNSHNDVLSVISLLSKTFKLLTDQEILSLKQIL